MECLFPLVIYKYNIQILFNVQYSSKRENLEWILNFISQGVNFTYELYGILLNNFHTSQCWNSPILIHIPLVILPLKSHNFFCLLQVLQRLLIDLPKKGTALPPKVNIIRCFDLVTNKKNKKAKRSKHIKFSSS